MMSELVNPYIKHLGFGVQRNPLLTREEGKHLEHILENGEFFTSFQDDKINEYIKLFVLAVRTSSKNLYSQMERYSDIKNAEEREKVRQSLIKYAKRAAARCTPYGLFSSVSHLKIVNEGNPILAGDLSSVDVKIDFGSIVKISKRLSSKKNRQQFVKLNDTIFEAMNTVRYIAPETKDNNVSYSLKSSERSAELDYIVQLMISSSGRMQVEEIARAVSDKFNNEIDICVSFVLQLLDEGIIVSSLIPSPIGPDPSHQFTNSLKEVGFVKEAAEFEAVVQKTKADNDSEILRASSSRITSVLSDIEEASKNIDEAVDLHLDLHRSPTNLSNNSIKYFLEELRDLAPLFLYQYDRFSSFRSRFTKRFGDKEVSLLQALDDDNGLEFGGKKPGDYFLISGMALTAPNGRQRSENYSQKDKVINRLLNEATSNEAKEILVNKIDLEQISDTSLPIPERFACMFSIWKSERKPEQDIYEIKFFESSGGLSMLSRFAGGSSALNQDIDKVAKEISSDGKVKHAEINHFPEGRIGNVLRRPNYYPKVISLLGGTMTDDNNTVEFRDILVGVQEGEIYLRDSKTRELIFPHLTTAHNFDNNVNLTSYRFLSAMAESKTKMGFSWGVFRDEAYLPRLSYGNIIVARARWKPDIPTLLRIKRSCSQCSDCIDPRDYEFENPIPNHVRLLIRDNFIPLDLSRCVDRQILTNEINKTRSCVLEEQFVDLIPASTNTEGGLIDNEFVVPFQCVNNESKLLNRYKFPQMGYSGFIQEHFGEPNLLATQETPEYIFGSEWVYVKVYIGSGSANKLLREFYNSISKKVSENVVFPPFFIRYADPDWHLRFRFKIKDPDYCTELLKQIFDELRPYKESGVVSRIEIASYLPEWGRYGGQEATSCIEEHFGFESEIISKVISYLYENSNGSEELAKYALAMNHSLASAFFPNDQELAQFYLDLSGRYQNEFPLQKWQRSKLKEKGRHFRDFIAEALTESYNAENMNYDSIAREYRVTCLNIANKLRVMLKNEREVLSVLSSLLHMLNNRLFDDAARPQEMIIYELLGRELHSLIARKKYAK